VAASVNHQPGSAVRDLHNVRTDIYILFLKFTGNECYKVNCGSAVWVSVAKVTGAIPPDNSRNQYISLLGGFNETNFTPLDCHESARHFLPGIDDLAIMEGRQVRAAFVYSDLHGFTKLVATQPGNKSFVFLHTFVEMATKLTKHYDGEVMDVAGDRVLSVFHRPSADLSNAPVEDAITFALQFQTIFEKVIGPAFVGDGLGQLSLGIGIDYGEAVVGCVGIRNNKRIVFFGDAANNAAKLQDMAGPSETVLSATANYKRPTYLNHQSWTPTPEKLANGSIVFRYKQIFAGNGENPVKAR